jgi:hypothetical protein
MKYIMLTLAILAAAAGAGYAIYPDEFGFYAAHARQTAKQAWDLVLANPVPVVLAISTFVLTVLYHAARGKSLRESVEVAATRVTKVTVPVVEAEPEVVKRAKARATRAQLLADQISLENRLRKLPAEITKAEKDVCYTEQAVADAERVLEARRQAHDEVVAKLESLRQELAQGEAEVAAIAIELKKLAEQV